MADEERTNNDAAGAAGGGGGSRHRRSWARPIHNLGHYLSSGGISGEQRRQRRRRREERSTGSREQRSQSSQHATSTAATAAATAAAASASAGPPSPSPRRGKRRTLFRRALKEDKTNQQPPTPTRPLDESGRVDTLAELVDFGGSRDCPVKRDVCTQTSFSQRQRKLPQESHQSQPETRPSVLRPPSLSQMVVTSSHHSPLEVAPPPEVKQPVKPSRSPTSTNHNKKNRGSSGSPSRGRRRRSQSSSITETPLERRLSSKTDFLDHEMELMLVPSLADEEVDNDGHSDDRNNNNNNNNSNKTITNRHSLSISIVDDQHNSFSALSHQTPSIRPGNQNTLDQAGHESQMTVKTSNTLLEDDEEEDDGERIRNLYLSQIGKGRRKDSMEMPSTPKRGHGDESTGRSSKSPHRTLREPGRHRHDNDDVADDGSAMTTLSALKRRQHHIHTQIDQQTATRRNFVLSWQSQSQRLATPLNLPVGLPSKARDGQGGARNNSDKNNERGDTGFHSPLRKETRSSKSSSRKERDQVESLTKKQVSSSPGIVTQNIIHTDELLYTSPKLVQSTYRSPLDQSSTSPAHATDKMQRKETRRSGERRSIDRHLDSPGHGRRVTTIAMDGSIQSPRPLATPGSASRRSHTKYYDEAPRTPSKHRDKDEYDSKRVRSNHHNRDSRRHGDISYSPSKRHRRNHRSNATRTGQRHKGSHTNDLDSSTSLLCRSQPTSSTEWVPRTPTAQKSSTSRDHTHRHQAPYSGGMKGDDRSQYNHVHEKWSNTTPIESSAQQLEKIPVGDTSVSSYLPSTTMKKVTQLRVMTEHRRRDSSPHRHVSSKKIVESPKEIVKSPVQKQSLSDAPLSSGIKNLASYLKGIGPNEEAVEPVPKPDVNSCKDTFEAATCEASKES